MPGAAGGGGFSPLARYRAFVKQHPSLVVNAERLLHWLAWTPERFSGSEFAYEGFNAAVGLLGVYNDAILSERAGQEAVQQWALALAALEQVQTLIELRAIHLEQRGKMSRYGPLIFLELLKCGLRLALWRASSCKLCLGEVSSEDEEAHECEGQLMDLLQALIRLRQRYNYDPVTAPTPEHLEYNAHLAHAAAVRAAAVAPSRPPAACAAGAAGLGMPVAVTISSASGGADSREAGQQLLRCSVCGATQDTGGSSCMQQLHQQQQGHQQCKVCGRALDSSSSSSQQQQLPGVCEITPDEHQHSDGSSGSQLRGGWWQRMTSGTRGGSSSSSKGQSLQEGGLAASSSSFAGSLPGTWGPGLPPYSGPVAGSTSSGQADASWQRQHARPLWCLSTRDASIGRSVMQAGELAYVLRPLVYVVLLKRYGLTSWKPWLTSLALDLASGYGLHTGHAILERSNTSRMPAGSTLYSLALLRALSSTRWSPGEQQELLGRRLLLLRYLLRSPCYTVFTRRLLLKAVAGSRYVPGLSNLADFTFSMVEGMQALYTYVES